MQPTCRQVPPRKGSFSITAVFNPHSLARIAATYPPGPLPMITRSYLAKPVLPYVLSSSRYLHGRMVSMAAHPGCSRRHRILAATVRRRNPRLEELRSRRESTLEADPLGVSWHATPV